MVMVYAGEETQNETTNLQAQDVNTTPTTFNRLTLMNAIHGGYIVFTQSGDDQIVLFAGFLRQCLEFMRKNIERV